MLQPDQVTDSLHAYQLAKRGNSLPVMAEAVWWGRRGRGSTPSVPASASPLATDELTGPGYRPMLELSRWAGAALQMRSRPSAALLLGPDGGFITGSEVLIDGGVTASYRFGDLAPP